MFRIFEVESSIDEGLQEMNLSNELKKSILSIPETADIYAKELQSETERLFKKTKNQTNLIKTTDMVYLNLDKALKNIKSKFNLVLNEGDSIIIPKTMDVVHITGELMNLEGNSISAPYFNQRRANYYIKNFAGGFNKGNDKSSTIVIYPSGIAKKSKNFLLFKVSPKATKGSIIRVASKKSKILKVKKNQIDWNRQIENAMLKISAVLTLWVLVDRVTPQ